MAQPLLILWCRLRAFSIVATLLHVVSLPFQWVSAAPAFTLLIVACCSTLPRRSAGHDGGLSGGLIEIMQLYRHYGADNDLLYVGVSLSATHRLSQHKDHARWFADIVRVEIEHHPSREEALAAERHAIETEKPKHNLIFNRPPKGPTPFEEAELARARLLSRTVNFKPMYTVNEAAAALAMTPDAIKRLINAGQINAIEDGRRTVNRAGQEYTVIKYLITGWQLIEYVEHLQRQGSTG